jgi:hypothetical protein
MSEYGTFYPTHSFDDGTIVKNYISEVYQDTFFDYDEDIILGDWEHGSSYSIAHSFFRFRNVNISKGSTIYSATLRLYVVHNYDEAYDCDIRAYMELVANSGTIIDAADFESRAANLSTAYGELNVLDQEEEWVEVDITSVLQEIIDQGDWVKGNNVQTILLSQASAHSDPFDTDIYIEGFDNFYETGNIVELVVEWDEPPIPTPILPQYDHFYHNRLVTVEYELLKLNAGIYKTAGLLDLVKRNSGVVSMDFTRDVIGDLKLDLIDDSSIDYITDLIRPWFIINGNRYPMGTYFLNKPVDSVTDRATSHSVEGTDILEALEQDKIDSSYVAYKGDNVITLVKALIASVGSWVRYEIQDNAATLSEDMSYEIGRSKLFIINGLLNTINYYPLWSNGYGVLKTIAWKEDPQITWTFKDDEYSLYMGDFKRTKNYIDIYNKVILVANQAEADTEPLISVKTMEDVGLSAHPLSYTNISRYRTRKFDSEASTQSYLDLRAKRELYKMLEVQEDIEFKHAFVTRRADGLPNQGDAYAFYNKANQGVYLLKKQVFNLKAGGLVNTTMQQIREVVL